MQAKTATLNAFEGHLEPHACAVYVAGHDVQHDRLYAKARMGVQLQASISNLVDTGVLFACFGYAFIGIRWFAGMLASRYVTRRKRC